MELRVYNCPACGCPLDVGAGAEKITCPACGSTVTVVREKNSGSTTFYDAATSRPIATALIPTGWKPSGEIERVQQSMARPFTARVEAGSPDGTRRLFFNTGESFHQVKNGMFERHIEGAIEQKTQTPMRTFVPPNRYLDAMASAIPGVERIELAASFSLPRETLRDIPTQREKYRRECASMFSTVATPGYEVEIQNIFIGGIASVYRLVVNKHERTLILGTEIKALEYCCRSAGATMLGNIGGLFKGGMEQAKQGGYMNFFMNGGLLNNNNRPQPTPVQEHAAPTAFGQAPSAGTMFAYIDWESVGVYGLIADGSPNAADKGIFNAFVSSLRVDPSIPARMDEMSKELSARLQRAQQQQFDAYQQAHQAQVASFDRMNQAWWNRTQQQDAARRSAYQSRMASEDSMNRKYSEAVRGVNTYIRPDGSETEYSVSAERVFVKNGDNSTMRSARAGEEVPFGWTELTRKN